MSRHLGLKSDDRIQIHPMGKHQLLSLLLKYLWCYGNLGPLRSIAGLPIQQFSICGAPTDTQIELWNEKHLRPRRTPKQFCLSPTSFYVRSVIENQGFYWSRLHFPWVIVVDRNGFFRINPTGRCCFLNGDGASALVCVKHVHIPHGFPKAVLLMVFHPLELIKTDVVIEEPGRVKHL